MTGVSDQLQPLAKEIVEEAVALVGRRGPSDAVLLELGVLLTRLASRVPKGSGEIGERELWRDTDGTFELVLRTLPGEARPAEGVGYDTWSVFAPVMGTTRFVSRQKGGITASLGDSQAFASGDIVSIEAVDGSAGLLCLYGIAREHLPPPVRQCFRAKAD